MSANFFVTKDESFTVVIPFDISDPEDPTMIFSQNVEQYPKALQAVPEESISFQSVRFRRPSWGLDCYLREISYEGGSLKERAFSQEKFDEVRIKYLLVDSSFFTDENKATFIKEGGYDVLSPVSEGYIRGLDPLVLKFFISMASAVWDFGIVPKKLITKEDYVTLRNDKDGLQKVSERRGFSKPEAKKKSEPVTQTTPDSATST